MSFLSTYQHQGSNVSNLHLLSLLTSCLIDSKSTEVAVMTSVKFHFPHNVTLPLVCYLIVWVVGNQGKPFWNSFTLKWNFLTFLKKRDNREANAERPCCNLAPLVTERRSGKSFQETELSLWVSIKQRDFWSVVSPMVTAYHQLVQQRKVLFTIWRPEEKRFLPNRQFCQRWNHLRI